MTEIQLSIFIQVAEQQSFTAAAQRLAISQSAVSHAISVLERELDVRLFRRMKAHVELTDVGARLLLRARELRGIYEAIRQEAADAKGLKSGTLRIGSFGPTASLRLLPPLLSEFRKRYPDVEVYIDEGPDQEVLEWIRDRRVDVGFVVLPEERFKTVHLITDQMLAVLPNNHPLAAEPAISIEALCDLPFVLTEAGSAKIVMELFAKYQVTPKIRYRSSQVISTLAHIQRGEAVTILAEMALPTIGKEAVEGVVALPLKPSIRRDVGLAYHNERQASPVTLAFIKLAASLYNQ